jgi:hypothetical protein
MQRTAVAITCERALPDDCLRVLAALLFIVAFIAGCASPAGITRPASSKDLLKNLKFALENGTLAQRELYTQEDLARFFGASQLIWRRNDATKISVDLRGLDYLPLHEGPARAAREPKAGIIRTLVDASEKPAEGGKPLTTLSVTCRCDLRLPDIEAVFGTEGRTIIDERERRRAGAFPDIAALPPATDPMGNRRVTYDINRQGYRGTMSVVFDFDGRVTTLEAVQREER